MSSSPDNQPTNQLGPANDDNQPDRNWVEQDTLRSSFQLYFPSGNRLIMPEN